MDESATLKGMALDFDDIEDASVCSVAQKANAEVVVTRDQAGFANSPLPVQTPNEFLATWKSTHSAL